MLSNLIRSIIEFYKVYYIVLMNYIAVNHVPSMVVVVLWSARAPSTAPICV